MGKDNREHVILFPPSGVRERKLSVWTADKTQPRAPAQNMMHMFQFAAHHKTKAAHSTRFQSLVKHKQSLCLELVKNHQIGYIHVLHSGVHA